VIDRSVVVVVVVDAVSDRLVQLGLTSHFAFFVRSFVLHSQPGVVKQREEARGEDGDGAGAKGPDTDEGLSAEQARARRACESDGGDGKAKEARDGVMERKANPYADDAAEVVKN